MKDRHLSMCKEVHNRWWLVALVVSVCIFFYGWGQFTISVHNIDIVHNDMNTERIVNSYLTRYNISYVQLSEQTVDYEIWDLGSIYLHSLGALFTSVVIMSFSVLAFGFILGRVVT